MSLRNKKVLILNADFRAFSICNVYRAFILVFMDKAEIVNISPNFKLRTIDRSFDVPSVIRLNNYVNIPYKGVMMSRQNIFRRDHYSCVYCGSKSDLTLDHVLPRSRGGESTWTNLVTACKLCNSKKGDLTPIEAEMPMVRNPFKPSFVMFLKNFSSHDEDDNWLPFLEIERSA